MLTSHTFSLGACEYQADTCFDEGLHNAVLIGEEKGYYVKNDVDCDEKCTDFTRTKNGEECGKWSYDKDTHMCRLFRACAVKHKTKKNCISGTIGGTDCKNKTP